MKQSAGILLYRIKENELQCLLAHPGGPFWRKKDIGWWTIPKGEASEGENLLEAAKREFTEETGLSINGKFIQLSPLKQKSGKTVHAWALEGTMDVEQLKSNFFEMQWPPKSGKMQSFPEIDKAEWFDIKTAHEKILPAQANFITQLVDILFAEGLLFK